MHEVTRTKDFYVQSSNNTPDVDIKSWHLEVSGLVEKPVLLSFDDILTPPPYSEYITICIGNNVGGNAVVNALWQGIKLKYLRITAGDGRRL
ncbi:MAG: molybdopterin-dependent oxidoreductase [Deltaproteobacteria bacterium]|nr:molybdopterin-dependent oxidoreductase [Deltaproteobacteria bacterium]